MPRTPAWLARTQEIRAKVTDASSPLSPLIDRASVEVLFSLKPRQAANLMKKMDGEVVGGANTVRREALLAYLDGKSLDPAGRAEKERKHNLARTLKEIRAAGPTLRAELGNRIPRSPDDDSPLPSGVKVMDPDGLENRLEIRYRSPGDILGAILGLAELSETDPAGFERGLEYRPPEDSENLED